MEEENVNAHENMWRMKEYTWNIKILPQNYGINGNEVSSTLSVFRVPCSMYSENKMFKRKKKEIQVYQRVPHRQPHDLSVKQFARFFSRFAFLSNKWRILNTAAVVHCACKNVVLSCMKREENRTRAIRG